MTTPTWGAADMDAIAMAGAFALTSISRPTRTCARIFLAPDQRVAADEVVAL